MAVKYHVNPETGNVLPCKALKKCRFGGEAYHYNTPEEGRAAFEERAQASMLTSLLGEQRKQLSKGAQLLLMLDRVQHAIALGSQREKDGPRFTPIFEERIAERRRIEKKIEALPWDDTDAPLWDTDETVTLATATFQGAQPRRGLDPDSFNPSPATALMLEQLDRASAVWLKRLSTAEIKAVVAYNKSSDAYAKHTAGEKVEGYDERNTIYLHSAIEKAPKLENPIVAYAGISGKRTRELNQQAQTGEINLNRIQSASANPAQVNGFMVPSDFYAEERDQTAVEFTINKAASLSAFNVNKKEMELLVPPGNYKVTEKLTKIPYYWGGKEDEERDVGLVADFVYKAEES